VGPAGVANQTYFQGSDEERMALLVALQHNCSCAQEEAGAVRCCPAHAMLHDQHVLDRLVFARRIEARLIEEEFTDTA
jgi:hypothetical protein